MTTTPDVDELRTRLHGMWASVAGSWGEHADYIDARAADVSDAMLDLVDPRPGDAVLELAGGPGGVGLAAAGRIGPGGEVVISDVVSEMTEIASRRAAELGLENVSTRVLDIERIDCPDGSFDVVVCREGLMFAAEPDRGAREIRRVLRPGGRAALACWGPRDRNPWLGAMMDSVSDQLGAPVPPPGIPGPFALSDRDRLGALLTEAGFSEVTVSEHEAPMHVGSTDEWWTRTTALAGPLAKIIANLDDDAIGAIRERAEGRLQGYRIDDGLEIPGVTLIASAYA